jgi:hypothetical protein
MSITKLTIKSFADSSVSSDKIADGSVMSSKISFNSNDAFPIPVGNTNDRPISPLAGAIRFNSDLIQFEVFDGISWSQL